MTPIRIAGVALFLSAAASAQTPVTQPASTRPAGDDQSARIIELTGSVSHAGAEGGAWQRAKVGDVLLPGTRIRTQVRSRVSLAFGDDTVVVIERATLASIDDFRQSADTKTVRLGLGRGTIRAGVAESTLRSDMTIETPTATLSKRGTTDFGIAYEPGTGRFRVWLAGEGLVEAFNKLLRQSREVRSGEYVTQAMLRWIDTATLDRWTPVIDVFGTTELEKMFHSVNDTGMAVAEPGGGTPIWYIADRQGAREAAEDAFRRRVPVGVPFITLQGPRFVSRPEGNFGTGLGASPRLRSAR